MKYSGKEDSGMNYQRDELSGTSSLASWVAPAESWYLFAMAPHCDLHTHKSTTEWNKHDTNQLAANKSILTCQIVKGLCWKIKLGWHRSFQNEQNLPIKLTFTNFRSFFSLTMWVKSHFCRHISTQNSIMHQSKGKNSLWN